MNREVATNIVAGSSTVAQVRYHAVPWNAGSTRGILRQRDGNHQPRVES